MREDKMIGPNTCINSYENGVFPPMKPWPKRLLTSEELYIVSLFKHKMSVADLAITMKVDVAYIEIALRQCIINHTQ